MDVRFSARLGWTLLIGIVVVAAFTAWLTGQAPSRPYSFGMLPTEATAIDTPPTLAPASGAAVYGQRCSTCHGDRGQGLTAAWRATWPEDHQNCSAPHCHGRDRNKGAAEIKNNFAPAVIAPHALAAFTNAAALANYVTCCMPSPDPSYLLSEEDHWQVANFLLWANGYIAAPYGITPDNAATISLEQPSHLPPTFEPVPPH